MSAADQDRDIATRPFGFNAVRWIFTILGFVWLGEAAVELDSHWAATNTPPLTEPLVTVRLLIPVAFGLLSFFASIIMPFRRETVRIGLILLVAGGSMQLLVRGIALTYLAAAESGWLVATGIALFRVLLLLVLANVALWLLRNDCRAWYETLPDWFPGPQTPPAHPASEQGK